MGRLFSSRDMGLAPLDLTMISERSGLSVKLRDNDSGVEALNAGHRSDE